MTKTSASDLYYLALDLETTGLSTSDPILEIGVIITDADYHEIASMQEAIRPDEDTIDRLEANPFVLEMHRASGLYDVLTSAAAPLLPTLAQAERRIVELVDEFVPAEATLAILGSGTARFDLPRVRLDLPDLADRLAYWENDPGSARRRYTRVTGHDLAPLAHAKQHRALSDLRDDLKFLRAQDDVFRTHLSAPLGDATAPERTLTGIALLEAYLAHDSFINGDGVEFSTAGTGEAVHALLRGTNPLNALSGLLDVAERLAELAGGTQGGTVQSLLRAMRQDAVAASDKDRA